MNNLYRQLNKLSKFSFAPDYILLSTNIGIANNSILSNTRAKLININEYYRQIYLPSIVW